jgi:selenocysteine lyase/cysteine desulfurase
MAGPEEPRATRFHDPFLVRTRSGGRARRLETGRVPIYLDNAATTFPKPPGALQAMVETFSRVGGSSGRGSHAMAAEAERLVAETRRQLASFFDAPDPDRVVFASNAT